VWGRRLDVDPEEQDAHAEMGDVFSLLERRMGAMARAIRDYLRAMDEEGAGTSAGLRAALTDAPPVFTRHEVTEAMRDANVSMDAACDTLERLAALGR
jgi:hypothetical protein